MDQTVIEAIAQLVDARARCKRDGNAEWFERHTETLRSIQRQYLPSGSGIDSGTRIDMDASKLERVVLTTAFHHMDDGGSYDGWTEHTIVITPSFLGRFSVRISGRDRNGIKEYLTDVFNHALDQTIER